MIMTYTGERLLMTLWIGSLWAIGYIAVPLAFISLETVQAGHYASKLFQVVNYLGIGCASILLISRLFMFGLKRFHLYWRSWILLLMLGLCGVFELYIQPEMRQIKLLDWQHDMLLSQQFGFLHQLAEKLYLGLSLLGLLMVLTTDKRAERTA